MLPYDIKPKGNLFYFCLKQSTTLLAKALSEFNFIVIILLFKIIIQNTALNYFPVCLHSRLKTAWTQLSNVFLNTVFFK